MPIKMKKYFPKAVSVPAPVRKHPTVGKLWKAEAARGRAASRAQVARMRMPSGSVTTARLGDAAFSWNPEAAEALIGASFSRTATPDVRVTENGVSFYDASTFSISSARELRLQNTRRTFNRITSGVTPTFILSVTDNGGGVVTFPGVSTNELADFGTGVLNWGIGDHIGAHITLQADSGAGDVAVSFGTTTLTVTLSSTPQTFFIPFTATADSALAIRVRNNAAGGPYAFVLRVTEAQQAQMESFSSPPPDYSAGDTVFNGQIKGAQYFATTNGNSVVGNTPTFATGVEFSGGGFLAESAAATGSDADIVDTDLVIPSIFTIFADVTPPDPLPTGDTIVAVGTSAAGGVGFIRVADDGTITAFDGTNTVTSTVTAVAGERLKAAYWRDDANQYLAVDGEAAVSGAIGSTAFEGGKFRLLATNGGDHWSTEPSPASKGIGHSFNIYEDETPSSADLSDFFV